MTAPQRIQLRRTRGWRLPAGAVVVARPTRWGNPYRVAPATEAGGVKLPEVTAETAVRLYRKAIEARIAAHPSVLEEIRRELGGRDLACWCRPGRPCHADVLLELANRPVCEVIEP
jgi:hypothetical protein